MIHLSLTEQQARVASAFLRAEGKRIRASWINAVCGEDAETAFEIARVIASQLPAYPAGKHVTGARG